MRRELVKWRIPICAIIVANSLQATSAPAQLLGQVSTARTLEPGTYDIGGYLGVFDDATTVFSQYRRGLSSSLDFGAQFGLIDVDARGSDASVIFGGDVKYQVMSAGIDPFDLALGGRMSFYDVGNLSVFAVGGAVILSRDYQLARGSILTPYGGVNVRMERTSFNDQVHLFDGNTMGMASAHEHSDNDETDLEIGGVAGARWELSDLIDALGEVVLDDDWGLVLGLNFKL